jgi:hypothetical protein
MTDLSQGNSGLAEAGPSRKRSSALILPFQERAACLELISYLADQDALWELKTLMGRETAKTKLRRLAVSWLVTSHASETLPLRLTARNVVLIFRIRAARLISPCSTQYAPRRLSQRVKRFARHAPKWVVDFPRVDNRLSSRRSAISSRSFDRGRTRTSATARASPIVHSRPWQLWTQRGGFSD